MTMCDKKFKIKLIINQRLRLFRFLIRKKNIKSEYSFEKRTTFKLNKRAKNSNPFCKFPTFFMQHEPARRHLV